MKVPHLTDARLSELFNGCDFGSMVTADDLFYIIARAVETELNSIYTELKEQNESN